MREIMAVKISPKTVKKDFMEKLQKLSGQNVQECFQCGTCTASCPMLDHMDIPPRKLVHMAQLGLEENIENIKTCWVCASCHSCNVRCPRGVDLPRVIQNYCYFTGEWVIFYTGNPYCMPCLGNIEKLGQL